MFTIECRVINNIQRRSGMNQSTTMVPKFREYVKGNESCYAETHLYEVLIHDVGLYIYLWMYYCHTHGGHHV